MDSHRSAEAMLRLREEQAIILPSLLQCNFGNLEREMAQLEAGGIKAFHLDVMDGHFVPNLTYGMPIVEAVRKLTDKPIDVHLMISEPGGFIQSFVDAGADCLTIHAEISGEIGPILEKIRSAGVGVGLALNPGTTLSEVEQELPLCDLLLMMSVNAGFGGQAFNPVALEKLETVKQTHPELLLEIDGGVSAKTIASCYESGASLFVVGSAIFGQSDYRQAIEKLVEAIGR